MNVTEIRRQNVCCEPKIPNNPPSHPTLPLSLWQPFNQSQRDQSFLCNRFKSTLEFRKRKKKVPIITRHSGKEISALSVGWDQFFPLLLQDAPIQLGTRGTVLMFLPGRSRGHGSSRMTSLLGVNNLIGKCCSPGSWDLGETLALDEGIE